MRDYLRELEAEFKYVFDKEAVVSLVVVISAIFLIRLLYNMMS